MNSGLERGGSETEQRERFVIAVIDVLKKRGYSIEGLVETAVVVAVQGYLDRKEVTVDTYDDDIRHCVDTLVESLGT